MKRDRGGHYRRAAVEETEMEIPQFDSITVPDAVEIQPIKIESAATPAPIKIVNQVPKENHVSLKDAFHSRLPPAATVNPPDDNSNDSQYSFTAPATAGQRSASESTSDPSEFSFGTPTPVKSVEEILRSVREVMKKEDEVKEEKIEVPAKEPPGTCLSFVCVCPCVNHCICYLLSVFVRV